VRPQRHAIANLALVLRGVRMRHRTLSDQPEMAHSTRL